MFFNVLKFIQLLIIIFTFVILPMESMSSERKDALVKAILSGGEDEIVTAILSESTDKLVEAILSGSEDLPKEVEGLSIGQVVNVPDGQWVHVVEDVEDAEDAEDGDYLPKKGEDCFIRKGWQLEILGFSYNTKLALVKNKIGRIPGTSCPPGALFFLVVNELKQFDERYELFLELERFRDDLVETILSGNKDLPKEVEGLSIGQVINVPDWQWVHVVEDVEDAEDAEDGDYLPKKGEVCGIKRGWQLEILGFSYNTKLALVTNEIGRIPGTSCPPGAVFFLAVDELKEFDKRYEIILGKKRAKYEMVEAILSGNKDLPKEVEGLFVGQIVNIPDWQRVYVIERFKNEKDRDYLSKGRSCGIERGGQLKVLGFSYDTKLALVKNEVGKRSGNCPPGAVFFLAVDELKEFDKRYEIVLEKKRAKYKLAEAILSGSEDLPKEVEGLSIGQVVNIFSYQRVNTVGQLNTVRQFDNPVGLFIKQVIDPVVEITPAVDSFLISAGLLDQYTITDDSCSIDDGEQLEVLGFSSDKMYVLVKNKIGGGGASCPAGAIFFLLVDTLLDFERE